MNPDILRNSVYKQKKSGGRFSSSGSYLKLKKFFSLQCLKRNFNILYICCNEPWVKKSLW